MRKILTFLFAALMSVGTIFAERVQIGDLYYNLDADNQTAEVTYQEYMSETNYSSLTAVNIPESVEYNSVTYTVTSIGESAFMDCTGLTSVTIPNSVTSIGINAFYYCSGLTSITIPNSVISIGDYAFMGCSGLTSITIPNSVTSIGDGAFFVCTGLTSVTIPNNVTSIGQMAFAKCSGLTSITIPNSVISIGNYAFSECSGLTSVTIGNSVTSIGEGAFSECSGLTSVTIGNSVTSIGMAAFGMCSSLASIEIPNSVISIGDWAFAYCSGLASVTILAESLESYGDYAFKGTAAALKIYVPAGSVATYKAAENWAAYAGQIEAIPVEIGDPNNATEIETFLTTNNGQTINELIIDRPVLNNMYNTLCLPFDMNATQIAASSLNGVEIFELNSVEVVNDELFLGLSDAVNAVVAGRPYIVKYSAASQLDDLDFENVTINNADLTAQAVTMNGVTFKGTFTPFVMGIQNGFDTNGGYLFLGQNNELYWPNTNNPLKPFRAYFYIDLNSGSSNAPLRYGMPARIGRPAQMPTGVESIQPSAVSSQKVMIDGVLYIIRGEHMYDAQGQIVK